MSKIILILIFSFSVFSQTENIEIKALGQVNPKKPIVGLEYNCQHNESIRLKLFNNSIWSLVVDSDEHYYKTKRTIKLANGLQFYTMPNDREISLRYNVERFASHSEKVIIPEVSYSDSFYANWIASDDSVLFTVPLKYLKNNLQIFVRFNYEWEILKNGSTVSGSEHRVSFRGIDVPDKVITCKTNEF